MVAETSRPGCSARKKPVYDPPGSRRAKTASSRTTTPSKRSAATRPPRAGAVPIFRTVKAMPRSAFRACSTTRSGRREGAPAACAADKPMRIATAATSATRTRGLAPRRRSVPGRNQTQAPAPRRDTLLPGMFASVHRLRRGRESNVRVVPDASSRASRRRRFRGACSTWRAAAPAREPFRKLPARRGRAQGRRALSRHPDDGPGIG